jgi:sec-independent protein translocase protein TatA
MAFGDLFDSPWKVLIIAIVVLVLFGSRKMPDAARSLGRSMRILKSEIKDLHEDDANGGEGSQQAQPQPQPQITAATGTPAASVPMAPAAAPAPSVSHTPAGGFPAAPVAPPAAAPVPAEVQQDTRPA